MMKLKASSKVEDKIPDSSMADIAFLLIIFFMVTTTFTVDKTPVTLPKTTERVEIPKDAITISVTHEGDIKIQGKTAVMAEVQNIAEVEVARNSERVFILKADKRAPYRYIDELLEQLRRAKVKNISLPTDRE